MSRHRLLLMHPMDPRGIKLGGIETHVRLVLERHPEDFRVLFVGVDEIGDLKIGEVTTLVQEGREIDFLPVARIEPDAINVAAQSLARSTTLRFALGALRRLPAIRAALRGGRASADLQRFEFALLPKLLGLKSVQMIHGEGSKDQKMDSLLKKHWVLHRVNEAIALALADRVLCVNENIVRRLETTRPRAARKCEVMTVSVDQRRFVAKPFDCSDNIFRIVFAGRLDAFKDPPLMFRVIAGVHARLAGRVEFHYVGATDPARYPESALIENFLVRHGYQPSAAVAETIARCHAGILTSFFEGMPCYLLEALSVGRPFAALRLPQFDPLVIPGTSGALIERTDPDETCEKQLIDAFVSLWDDIRSGRIDPFAVGKLVEPYSVERQMSRLFAHHRTLQNDPQPPGNPGVEGERALRSPAPGK
jgi:glycosyltransferase involved in cell wall biosynthesis